MNLRLKFLSIALMLGLSSTALAQATRKPLFGETHIHTVWSFNAYLFNTRATPDDAYEFAKGKPLKHPLGKSDQLSRPLDFMAVTDHGLYLGVFASMADKWHPLNKHSLAAKVTDPDPSVMASAFTDIITASRSGNPTQERAYSSPIWHDHH